MVNSYTVKFNEYRKLRDLLNATFAFTRQEIKPLFKSMLILAMPLLILLGIVLGIFQTENMSMITDSAQNPDSVGLDYFQNLMIQYGLIFIIYYLAISVISAIVLGYIVEYINNGPQVPFENILAQVKAFLPRLLALNFVYFILVGIGFIFFIIPGMYLYIAMALSSVVLVFEDTGLGTSLQRSMYFVKGYWWRTLGYIIVIGLIYALISTVFSMPAGILTILQSTGLITAAPDSPLMLMLSIVLNIISTLAYLFSSLVIIFLAFYYHSQYELKEAGNLMKGIDELGSSN